jgi:D-beta-D-heptose 7-phosphate kinase/D-beta-D-heptose 1-phosphate adenosyltransferase
VEGRVVVKVEGLSGAQRLRRIVKDFESARILVLGDVMVDRYYWGQVRRISPEAPVPVVRVTKETRRLGGAANVAHNVSALGGKAFLSGVAGRDRDGDWLLEELQRLGIDGSGIMRAREIPTIVKSRVVAHSQQVVRFDRESDGEAHPALPGQTRTFLKDIWKDVDAVVVSDYGKGVVGEELLDFIRSLNRGAARVPVAVDPKSLFFERYRRMTVITPNYGEAVAAAALAGREGADITRVGQRLLSRTKAQAILVTRGEEGMSLFERGEEPLHIPTEAREVYDVTGAGDTVIATLALALAAGAGLREAAFLANLAAGIVVAEFGTVPIRRRQLLDSVPRRLPF